MDGWHLPASPALPELVAGRTGAGHAADHLLLLGLLQHLLSRQRSAQAGTDDSACDSALGALCRGVLYCDEHGSAAIDVRCGSAHRRGRSVRLQLVAEIAKRLLAAWPGG